MKILPLFLVFFLIASPSITAKHEHTNHQTNEPARNLFAKIATNIRENENLLNEEASYPLTKLQSSQSSRLTLHFTEIPVRELLVLLAALKKINLVLSETVNGTMTTHLADISWEQALSTVLLMHGLDQRTQDNILFIASMEEILRYSQQIEQTQALTTALIPVHYAKAADLGALLQGNSHLLSERGNVLIDTRTNTLWIKDTPQKLKQAQQFLNNVDIPAQQVLISARIVNVDQDFVRELGLKFATTSADDSANKMDQLHMDLPIILANVGHFTIAVAKLGEDALLDLELSALEREGHAQIISNPELITANHQPASIESGQEIPYQEKTSSGATNTAFKKAVLSLKVTPEITAKNNKVLLTLIVNQDKVSPLTINGVPAISTQEVQTQILVNNGETIVLGGIYEQTNSQIIERIPFWGSIPLLGALFTHKQTQTERKELLIFVTPRIIEQTLGATL